MDDLSALEDWAGALLAKLDPAQRRAAAGDIGRALRRSQAERIKAQRAPDGAPFDPRKPRQLMRDARLRDKPGRVKRKAMFVKLRTSKFLKATTDDSGLAIGFMGRAARLARVHQEGETSEVAQGGASYHYPVRQLLGFTDAERELIRDKLLEHLTR